MFRSLTLKQKLLLPLAFIITLIGISSTVSVLSSWKQTELSTSLNQQIIPKLFVLEDAYRDMYQATSAIQGLALADSKVDVDYHLFEYKDNAYKAIPRMQKPAELTDNGLMPAQFKSDVAMLVELGQVWLKDYETMINMPQQQWYAHYKENSDEFDKKFAAVRAQLNVVKEALEGKQAELHKQIESATRRSELVLEAGNLIVLISAIATAFLLLKTIVAPVKNINDAMEQIASGEGDLRQRIEISSKDEIGQLAESFNEFVSKIQHTVEQVMESSETLRAEMGHLQSLTSTIHTSTTHQQRDSEAVAAAVNEMQVTSRNVSDNAQEAANASQTANVELNNTNTILDSAVDSIRKLDREIETASEVINTLDQDVNNISSVIDVIQGIAEQTNLLALNAAIEAARAGEQGRGFAVVADEVRNLASRTQQSTGEIQAMIEKLQQGASQAVAVMQGSKESGEVTINAAGEASRSLSEILNAISLMNEMNTHIATAASQQSTVSEEVNSNVQRIADSSTEIVDIMGQAQETLIHIDEQCQRLDAQVRQFRV